MARMDVLLYGTGATVESVRHSLYSLRRLLSPHYAVKTVNAGTILNEPWTGSCALLVMPGGADLEYCRDLNDNGNRIISKFIQDGGAYLGFCAGGYYGSSMVEFEVGNSKIEVFGTRELGFFGGACRGAAFKGFDYTSERGARAPKLKVEKKCLDDGAPEEFRSYYNGGGLFVDADKYANVEVLARYTEDLDVTGGDAAVIYCKVGRGGAVLTGPHPEFAGTNLGKNDGPNIYADLINAILEDDAHRIAFLKSCLIKLGLNTEGSTEPPPLSRMHLSSLYPTDVWNLVKSLKYIIIATEDGTQKIIGENDTFILENSQGTISLSSLSDALEGKDVPEEGIANYNKIEKRIQIHDKAFPLLEETPYFNHDEYYKHLTYYRSQSSPGQFGSFILYGEVVTSTNTMLCKNFQLLHKLPSGLTVVATTQVSGKGRGNNVWVSPVGALLWSTAVRHPPQSAAIAPVVFVQYLVALAVIEAIKKYGPGYEEMPVRLKWPNDIYAENPTKDHTNPVEFVKTGGILVNCSHADNQYFLVVGVGINVTNRAPTTSLNLIVEALNLRRKENGLPALSLFKQEKLLPSILVRFEEMYNKFCSQGFGVFEVLYYKHWLHTNQVVRLEMEGNAKARIRGITMDEGLLRADELDDENDLTGRVFTLQSDNNSFDFFKGLLKKRLE